MPIFHINNQFSVYKGNKKAEFPYRQELSKQIIKQFGKNPYDQTNITEIIVLSLNYYVEKFENICRNEKSYTFYKNIFWFHEQVTEATHKKLTEKDLPVEISGNYLASYRRILKYIIEQGCEVDMASNEELDAAYIYRVTPILDDLMFLGEMIMTCVDLYAEQRMIEDVAEISFNENDLYVFRRRHHYDFIFQHLSKELNSQVTKHVVDPKGFEDFDHALQKCLNIKYSDVSHVMAGIQQELGLEHGEVVAVDWNSFIFSLSSFGVPNDKAEQFFAGLRLDKSNRMSLLDLACKPYNLNRFIYRPIVIWTIDGKKYGVYGSNSWTEAIIQLTTNAIAWGKAPKEWMTNACFKTFVHAKEDEHDKWLDDAVEQILLSKGLKYDRNVKGIRAQAASINIDVPGLGEIDFIIIAEKIKKIFIIDCKHLLGRYDMANQRNDYNAFAVGSKNTKSYNDTLKAKLVWFNANKKKLEEHFQFKYEDDNLSMDNYDIEGIFIVNGPTFYMYNAEYRIYTIDQIADVLLGKFVDQTFMIVIDEEDTQTILNVKYPYFKKPTYIAYDPLGEEEEEER